MPGQHTNVLWKKVVHMRMHKDLFKHVEKKRLERYPSDDFNHITFLFIQLIACLDNIILLRNIIQS